MQISARNTLEGKDAYAVKEATSVMVAVD